MDSRQWRGFVLLAVYSLGCVSGPAFVRPPAAPVKPVARPQAPRPPPRALDTEPYFAHGELLEAKQAFDRQEYRQARALLAGSELPGARFLRALSAHRAGDNDVAGPELLQLAVDYPALRDRCLLLAGLSFERAGALEPAFDAYGKVARGTTSYAEACFGIARLKEREGALAPALAALQPLLSSDVPSSARAQALWRTAALHRALGDLTSELNALATLWAEHPLSSWADRAAARLPRAALTPELRQRRALLLFQSGATAEGQALAPETEFRTFWWHRKSGDFGQALAALERLEAVDRRRDSETNQRAQYWRARLWEERGDRVRATRLFEAIALGAPATYYGLLAKRRLPALTQATELMQDGALQSLYDDPQFIAGVELMRLGLPEAPKELTQVELDRKPGDARPLLLRILYDAGHKKQVAALSRKALSGAPTPHTAPVWRLAFPPSFRRLVERSAARSEVDPDYLQAIVREESRFNPAVRSSAGAVGLGQLMPQTARLVAAKAGIDFSDDALLEPHHNLRLSALYLRSLLDQFGGNIVYATASYNAGPGAVLRWLKDRPSQELDEWVEEIPYWETRHYVKKVLASYAAYALLAEKGTGSFLAADLKPLAQATK